MITLRHLAITISILFLGGCAMQDKTDTNFRIIHTGEWTFKITIQNNSDDHVVVDKTAFMLDFRVYDSQGVEVPRLPVSLLPDGAKPTIDVPPNQSEEIDVDLSINYERGALSDLDPHNCSVVLIYSIPQDVQERLTPMDIELRWPSE